MTRLDFFLRLREGLQKLPPEEIENAVRYYTEYFDDAGEENVQKVLEELGDPMKIAQQITAEYMVRDLTVYRPQNSAKKGLSAVWIAVLAVFASPIALPIAIAIAGVAFALVAAAAAVLLAFFCGVFALIIAGLAVFIAGFFMLGVHVPTGLCAIGMGLLVAGLGLLLFLPVLWLAKATFSGIARLISRNVTRRKTV
ncbi:HAAS signaling domain-containing protein [Hydrogenoanaerobacterium sp.]|uniref:DUF1700 domain-containing protein n=1 Tax=Hydrogenoanaerobacterium sp. TaxID=2953763 RepID=UPI00289BAE7B|nr:DUF1700 domain-containing protein [Hydrogenoanaerobacterium sp.]